MSPVLDDYYHALCNRYFVISLTPNRLSFFRAWERREGGKARYNPFNSEYVTSGSTFYNHTSPRLGVQNYPNMDSGVWATYQTLKNYHEIVAGIRSDNPWNHLPAMRSDFLRWSGGNYSTLQRPTPPLPPPLGGKKIMRIVQVAGNPAQYVTDGIYARRIGGPVTEHWLITSGIVTNPEVYTITAQEFSELRQLS